jgi:hypothetical protein
VKNIIKSTAEKKALSLPASIMYAYSQDEKINGLSTLKTPVK